jgi:hypothetical protein
MDCSDAPSPTWSPRRSEGEETHWQDCKDRLAGLEGEAEVRRNILTQPVEKVNPQDQAKGRRRDRHRQGDWG